MTPETKEKLNAWAKRAKDKVLAFCRYLKRTVGPAVSWCRMKITALWQSGRKGKAICIGVTTILLIWLFMGSCDESSKNKGQTVTEYREWLMQNFKTDLADLDSDWCKGFKNSHVPSVTLKSARLLSCEVKTKDGGRYVGPNEENIKETNTRIRFDWEGLSGNGQTVMWIVYDGVADAFESDFEYTTQDYKEVMMCVIDEELKDADNDLRKRIESAHWTVKVKSASVVNCEVTTRDGTTNGGKDFENISGYSMLVRFNWSGWTEDGVTDLRIEYDAINDRGNAYIEHTTAKINDEEPGFWWKAAGSTLQVLDDVGAIDAFLGI